MPSNTQTLLQVLNNERMQVIINPKDKRPDTAIANLFHPDSSHYLVVISRSDKFDLNEITGSYSFYYSQGPDLRYEPTVLDVLEAEVDIWFSVEEFDEEYLESEYGVEVAYSMINAYCESQGGLGKYVQESLINAYCYEKFTLESF
jgi:hypothetical protein